MTIEMILVLAILAGAVVLFVTEKLRVDVIAMLVLIALSLTGLVTIEEAFSGFASTADHGLGGLYRQWRPFRQRGGGQKWPAQCCRPAPTTSAWLVIMVTVGVMSSVMNNIRGVAILLPAVVSVGRSIDVRVSKLLIPLAFVSLLGGNMTLIGTPPNILATSIMESYGGMEPFGFLDFLPMGILVLSQAYFTLC